MKKYLTDKELKELPNNINIRWQELLIPVFDAETNMFKKTAKELFDLLSLQDELKRTQ